MTRNRTSHGPSASQLLCSHLALGLHAAAQPLTVLLASLGKGHTDGMNVDELRALTASSAIEVQRVCTLFGGLQQLLIVESMPPLLSATPVVSVIAEVVEGVNKIFEQDGMSLSSRVTGAGTLVFIDRARTHQALSSVLLVSHALSSAKDCIEVIAGPCNHEMRIEIRNPGSHRETCSTEASLGMALAEANIRSQQGKFSWSRQPFTVQIAFPVCEKQLL